MNHNNRIYLIRSIKYLIWLVLLFTLLFMLMLITETSRVDAETSLTELFGSRRGQLMLCVIVVLAAFYPKFGFTQRRIETDATRNREVILQTFASSGFSLLQEQGDTMTFRASSPLKRILLLWEDRIIVTNTGNAILLDGIRKEVVKVEFRLKSYLQHP